MVVILLLLFLLAPCATSLNFSFPTFPNGINTLSLEGDALVDGDFLQLTKSAVSAEKYYSVGRATYSQPFLLRDNATGKLADFTTTFTFTIDSQNKPDYSDGLAFFLAQYGSALYTTIGRGPSLGLPIINPEKKESTKLYMFVAVEFDIFQNLMDPAGDHVGIDVNSIKSNVTRAWNGSITQGLDNNAWIRYDSGSKNLSVTFTTYENGAWVERDLAYMVDLNEILQGWVIVGFSAATGSWTALHKIKSWSFNSTSLIDENARNNTPVAPCATSLHFSFPTFPNGIINNLSLEGDAYVDGEFLQLTKSTVEGEKDYSVGRATYRQPFLLCDNATGKLADFTTTFTFTIDSQNKPLYSDGLAFFLAPNGSALNTTIGRGPSLGLRTINPEKNESTNLYPFVAVEFDIFHNDMTSVEDPPGDHVGIDINSVKSNVTKAWNGSITQGRENNASIRYDSGSKNLSVTFTTYENGVWVERDLAYVVDLNEILQGWVIVGFSAATGSWTALHKIKSWSFNPTPIVEPESGNGINIGLVVGLVVGGCVLLVGGFCLVWFIFWKKRGTGESSDNDEDPMINTPIDDEFEKGAGPRKFSYSELARATSNFEEGEKLGEGGFGGVYKGFIPDLNSYVAVKRISSSSKQGPKEYASEVKIISRLRHRNLVQLIGWCHERKFTLVYEFMPNGSLDSHLFKEQSLLTWEARYKIAQGLASALFYLHEEWEQCVLHRDIKSSNVMLDSNFNAKLGDFGLARLVDHGKQSQTTILAGTMGYMAPDYLNTGKASKESDVYSFGVVGLEIACGRKPIDPKFGSSKVNMVEWVWELYGEDRVNEAADPKLCGDFDKKQMECLMIVGLWCAHPDCNMRPSIQQAIQVLNFEAPLPNLPSKMPVATYFAPPKSLSMLSRDISGSQGGQTESSSGQTNSSQFSAPSSATNSHPKISLG